MVRHPPRARGTLKPVSDSPDGADPFHWQDLRREFADWKVVLFSRPGACTRRMGIQISKDHLGLGMRSGHAAMEPGINDAGEDRDPYGAAIPGEPLAGLRAKGRETA